MKMSIHKLFYPEGVVVIGSMAEGKIGHEIALQIRRGGYEKLFAVNPKAQGVLSVPGYDAVSKIEHPVDLAVIATPPSTVSRVMDECGRAGIKAAAIITAGFAEVGNHEGETEIKKVAGQYGIRFIGPNCAGFVNSSIRLCPTLETRPPAGKVGFITQSGAVGGVFLGMAKEEGLGISKFINYGNGADLNELDLLQYYIDNPETEVVCLYMESVSDGRAFMKIACECTRKKPLIVMKSGRTSSGMRAALSHTSSLAGSDDVFDACLKQCGAIRVFSVEEMFDLAKGFTILPPLSGKKVAIVTNSGGPGILAADKAEEMDLEVLEPGKSIKEELSGFLPGHCATNNPIDLTVEGNENGYRNTLQTVLKEYDAVLALNITTPYLDSIPLAKGIAEASKQSDKPVLTSFLPRYLVSEAVNFLERQGIPNYHTAERAVTVISHMANQREAMQLCDPDIEESTLPGSSPMLEPEAVAWLVENNIPVPENRFADNMDETLKACQEIGYPVVMKVVSKDIVHKTDSGGVVLDIKNEAAASSAFNNIRQAAVDQDFQGVIIYPYIKGGREVLVGISSDPQFGPVVVFGMGGVYTEIFKDISMRVAPVDVAEAKIMVRETKLFKLLKGVRGEKPVDIMALAELISKVSQLPFQYPDLDRDGSQSGFHVSGRACLLGM